MHRNKLFIPEITLSYSKIDELSNELHNYILRGYVLNYRNIFLVLKENLMYLYYKYEDSPGHQSMVFNKKDIKRSLEQFYIWCNFKYAIEEINISIYKV